MTYPDGSTCFVTLYPFMSVGSAQETVQADPHSPGSALPPSSYAADIGYLVDGTPCLAAKR